MSKKLKIGITAGIIFCVSIIVTIVFILSTKTYTIEFDSNGGSSIESQIVTNGDKVVKPIDPVKKGYDFDGWYLDNSKYYFDTKVTRSFKLEAKWTKQENVEKVTVTFDTKGGSKISSKKIIKGGKLIKPTDPTKEGYVFEGWLLNNNEFNFDMKIMSDIKLVASWKKLEEDSFSVTFDSKGGSSVSAQVVKKDEKVSKPNDPTKNGYKFEGWYLNNKKYDFNEKVTKNITLTAKWSSTQSTNKQNNTQTQTNPSTSKPQTPQVVKYNVTFNSNGGSAVATQVVTAGAKATVPNPPARNGYKFIGWMLNGGAYNFDLPVNNNITLVANWELIPVPDVYTVRSEVFDINQPNLPDIKILVFKNGNGISASAVLNQDGKVIGRYNSNLGVIRGQKSQYDAATSFKVELNDGTIVSANKG